MRKKITVKKNMTIDQVLALDPNFANILIEYGMHCFGCPMSRLETLSEAGDVHGFNVDELVDKLNRKLENKK